MSKIQRTFLRELSRTRISSGVSFVPTEISPARRSFRIHLPLSLKSALLFALLAAISAPPLISAQAQALPDAPSASQAKADPAQTQAGPHTPANDPSKDTATVSGTVLDSNGDAVAGAYVALENPAGKAIWTVTSGLTGEFTFTGLNAETFKLAVSVPRDGWGAYESPQFQLHAGDFHLMSGVILPLTSTESVRVSADPTELAQEQVQIALQQRVLGVIPNFYTSYDQNAPPMQARQKFHLALRSVVDPVEFFSVAGIAGIEQISNNFSGFGGGFSGYAKRYGAAYGGIVTSRALSSALLPSIFHQDPRYFYLGAASSGKTRLFHALTGAFVARGDNGHAQPNYSRMLGSFASAAVTNFYYPSEDRGLKLTMINGAVHIGDYALSNLIREFVLDRITTKNIPKFHRKHPAK